jgi:hypothetical protein
MVRCPHFIAIAAGARTFSHYLPYPVVIEQASAIPQPANSCLLKQEGKEN